MLYHPEVPPALLIYFVIHQAVFVIVVVLPWVVLPYWVTGFRGETRELEDMEGRVKADIWYMEHWSFLLDLYIMYKTVANVLHKDKQAY